jgi:hypothetical protein
VEHVSGDGSDWNGDTEGGFYSRFSVDIQWRNERGEQKYYDADGEDAESLWKWVVRAGWPREQAQAQ